MCACLCYTVVRIAAAVYEVLRPILNEIKEDISCMKSDIASLNETVSQLAGKLEDHKNETTSELASVNSELVALQLSLQSMIDNPPTEAVSSAVLVSLVSYFNAMESSLKTELATGLNAMNSSLRDDMNDLNTELATSLNCSLRDDLRDLGTEFATSLNSVRDDLNSMELDIKTEFSTGMNSMSGSIRDDLNDIKSELSGVTNTTQGLCDKIEEHDADITAELMDLSHYIIPQSGYTCGGTEGWRRAIYLDMTDPNTECPSGWSIITSDSKRMCGIVESGCTSVYFPVSGGPYSQVCGRIRAYQGKIARAFYGHNYRGYDTISSIYFDGVAIIYGSPRQHIWTFAAGRWENHTSSTYEVCPCDTTSNIRIPPFVGEDYFCESGYVYPGYRNRTLEYRLHSNDTLWDGEGCHSSSSCCSLHNPPYFTKSLDQTTTDDLELRMCSILYWGKIAIELLEVYVKEVDLHSKLDLIGEHMNEVKSKLMEINQNILNHTNPHTCGGTGGWRRAVYLDMKDPNTNCPSGWSVTDYSKRTCGRASTRQYTCDSVFFPVSGGPYSQVCGRIIAYQWGLGMGFSGFRYGEITIDSTYFDGVVVMHGSPRQHIWTFASGAWEIGTAHRIWNCPCDTPGDIPIPPFVGEDYFCESGYVYPGYRNTTLERTFHSDDTLWDGEGCHSISSCCSLHNPPYFTKSLGQSTTDDLELRICQINFARYSNEAVELVELYVKQ